MPKKILVIGDVMLDHYVYGVVSRMSPEAPVPVLDVEKEEFFPGGAGIVASALAGLGVHVHFLSVVGMDVPAAGILKLLSEAGVSFLPIEEARKTTLKTRFVKTKPLFQMLLRADSETRQPISAAAERAVLERLESAAKDADFIIISDYAKGMLTKKLAEGVLAFARAKGKRVVVDTKGDISAYTGGNVILVPNLHELGAASGAKDMKNEDAEVRACALALSKSSGSVVVVKRSGKGASIADAKANSFRTWPSMAKGVVNVSGAGDIFVAIFTLALASGKSMDEAVKLANAGCAKAITKQHPSITKAELPELD
jgi:D-beta-D-heptose 7-phosphate kinase / D-beta-D-heptose 1-phosphate adenosyltransferase